MTTAERSTIVDTLRSEWDRLSKLLSELTDDQLDAPTELPGWTVQDNIAHVVGTERMLLGHPTPDAPTAFAPHVKNDIAKANEAWVQHYRQHGRQELKADFDRFTAERLTLLEAMDQAAFEAPSWTPAGNDTYQRFMQIRAYDSWFHRRDVERALGIIDTDEDAPRIAVAEITNALGYIAAKKAGAKEGELVRFQIGTAVIDVEVHAGRGTVLDTHSDREPTATVSASADEFFRAAGGRCSPRESRTSGAITSAGDADLAARVIDSLTVMI